MKKLVSDVMVELHVPDFEVVKKFYGGLGFEIVWERRVEDRSRNFLVMRRGDSIINFYCGSDEVYKHTFFGSFPKETPRGYAVEIIIPIDGVESFYKAIQAKYKKSIVRPYDHKFSHPDFRMVDPHGFYLRFVERYNWVEGRDSSGTVVAELE